MSRDVKEVDLIERPRVLLVDDDPVNLMLIEAALQEHGFEVTALTGGQQALQLVTQWTPELIVLDALMPDLDGFETCERLRALPGFENAPILMPTGLDDEASINRAYQAGATDFFVKSTQWRLLAGRLRYMLRSARTRQELERSKSKLARAQDLARMGSFEWQTGHGFKLANEALRVFGRGPSDPLDFIGVMRMVPREERLLFMRLLRDVVAHNSVLVTDLPFTLLDGRKRVIHIEAEPEFNEHGNACGYTGVIQDVTDRRMAEDRIRELANFDALTGLPNRRQLMWRAERAIDTFSANAGEHRSIRRTHRFAACTPCHVSHRLLSGRRARKTQRFEREHIRQRLLAQMRGEHAADRGIDQRDDSARAQADMNGQRRFLQADDGGAKRAEHRGGHRKPRIRCKACDFALRIALRRLALQRRQSELQGERPGIERA